MCITIGIYDSNAAYTIRSLVMQQYEAKECVGVSNSLSLLLRARRALQVGVYDCLIQERNIQ